MNNEVEIFKNVEGIADYFAKMIIYREATSKNNFVSIALSGGNTPKKIFERISEKFSEDINWKRIRIFWGDERCVPPESSESNFGMANETLLSKINIPLENIYRIQGEKLPSNEADKYSELIKELLPINNGFPQFDIVMLGLGDDGHTVSIFPSSIGLFYSSKICEVTKHPETGQNRITITGNVINNAFLKVFIATGNSKAERVKEVISTADKSKGYPASLVDSDFGKVYWLIDEEAASKL